MRHVEITGPTDRKMVINALNSGADMYMADFEDSLTPSWKNIVEGQINLLDANKKTISFTNADGKYMSVVPITLFKAWKTSGKIIFLALFPLDFFWWIAPSSPFSNSWYLDNNLLFIKGNEYNFKLMSEAFQPQKHENILINTRITGPKEKKY